jgi:hypothetical protein
MRRVVAFAVAVLTVFTFLQIVADDCRVLAATASENPISMADPSVECDAMGYVEYSPVTLQFWITCGWCPDCPPASSYDLGPEDIDVMVMLLACLNQYACIYGYWVDDPPSGYILVVDVYPISPLFAVGLYTDPIDSGTITFDGDTYSDGDSTFKSNQVYALTANPEYDYAFDHWSATGGINIADEHSQSTTVTIDCHGSIKAWFFFCEHTCGDVNRDCEIDIDDAVYLIAYIFVGGPAPDPLEDGNVDCSGGVDIDDVVYLINFIFSGGNAPCDTDGDEVPDC